MPAIARSTCHAHPSSRPAPTPVSQPHMHALTHTHTHTHTHARACARTSMRMYACTHMHAQHTRTHTTHMHARRHPFHPLLTHSSFPPLLGFLPPSSFPPPPLLLPQAVCRTPILHDAVPTGLGAVPSQATSRTVAGPVSSATLPSTRAATQTRTLSCLLSVTTNNYRN